MPQGRRKVPFSGKQKKQQLSEKKQSKGLISTHVEEDENTLEGTKAHSSQVQKINMQPHSKNTGNRYVLQFHKETNQQLKQMREEARKPLSYVSNIQLEIDDEVFTGHTIPIRPEWTYKMSKEEVDANENRYFFNYVKQLEEECKIENGVPSYFELNLETWRQLWRVLEISDIVLFIVDIRIASYLFPPAVYHYVYNQLGKHIILVLNKIDLVPSTVVLAWKIYFEKKYPAISIVLFSSYPAYNLYGDQKTKTGLQIRHRRGKMRMAVEGAQSILHVCKEIVGSEIDLTSWETKLNDEIKEIQNVLDNEEDSVKKSNPEVIIEDQGAFQLEKHVKYKNGILTIGCVGFPNVGKSSLLNALMGKKVVSVSRTPGHTKHFQTIFLTQNVRLCDCPGLVFPSNTPRAVQVLLGSFPIAQLREPFVTVKYLAERVDVPKMLNIKHPDGDENEWSAMDICTAWALKRGFLTAKAARPDTYRAANSILRMALDGKITLVLRPVGYSNCFEELTKSVDLVKIEQLQSVESYADPKAWNSDSYSDSDDTASSDGEKLREGKFGVCNSFDLLKEETD